MDPEVTENNDRRKWPWWEPYVFTAGVLAAFVVVLIAFGFLTRIPYLEPALFVVMTFAAAVNAFRRCSTTSSLAGNLCLTMFFGLASAVYLAKSEFLLGGGYGTLAVIWLCLAVRAGIIHREFQKERSDKLDRAVEILRRATQDNE